MATEFKNSLYAERWPGSQRRIGITGSIATGKSTVANYLKKKKHIPSIDADLIVNDLLTNNKYIKNTVYEKYGEAIITEKKLNKKRLANIIFCDSKERQWLEDLIHPEVKKQITYQLSNHDNVSIISLIVPLLFEAKLHYLCSEIWVVKCGMKKQYDRLIKRDKLNIKEARLRVESQMSLSEKEKLGDIVIDNSGSKLSLASKIERII